MTTFLFWNINRKPLIEALVALVKERSVDVLVLAESTIPRRELLWALNQETDSRFRLPFNPSERIEFYTRFSSEFLRPVADGPTHSIRRLRLPARRELTLVAVHMHSKLHLSLASQQMACTQLIDEIERAEQRIGHRQTILLGDFNMNPFEYGVVGAGGLHAVMTKERALRGARTVEGKQYRFFYNPMWSCLGDRNLGPPGTYHSSRSEHICYFWNTFDQVMIRPDLLPCFEDEHLEIITTLSGQSLLSNSGVPNVTTHSDHLPICITLNH